jgi:hypothetical protein
VADVFLSYAQEDRTRAEQVADALRELGWDVWWDARLYGGTSFRAEIARQSREAKCVVVLWSKASVESDWVIDEAEDGRQRGVLVQALIADVQPPRGFRRFQWANLTSWAGDLEATAFRQLAEAVARHAASPLEVRAASKPLAVPIPSPVAMLFASLALLSATVLIAYRLRDSTVASSAASIVEDIGRPFIQVGLLMCGAALIVSVVRHAIELVGAIRLISKLRREQPGGEP